MYRFKTMLCWLRHIFSQHRLSTPPIIVLPVSAQPIICILYLLCWVTFTPYQAVVRSSQLELFALSTSCSSFCSSQALWTLCFWLLPQVVWLKQFLVIWRMERGVRSHIFVGRYPSHFETLAARHLIRTRTSFPQVVLRTDVS